MSCIANIPLLQNHSNWSWKFSYISCVLVYSEISTSSTVDVTSCVFATQLWMALQVLPILICGQIAYTESYVLAN